MFKNSVFKGYIDTREWARAAGIRAVKTMAQVAVAGMGTAAAMGQVDWKGVASMAALSGITSILTSVAGIPEVK